QGVRVFFLRHAVEALDEFLDPLPPMPTDDRRRDFVSDAVAEIRRMTGAGADPLPNSGDDFLDLARFVQEGHVLSPVEADHDPEPVLQGHVQKPTWRTRVDPYDVETVRRHEGEIPCDHLRIQALLAVVVDEERAVADAPDPELLLPDVQELPADRRAADDQRPFDGDCRCDLGHVHHSFETDKTLAESGAIPRSSGSGAPVLARSSVFSPRHTRPRAEGLAGFSQSPAGLRTSDGFGGPVERPGERKNRFHF